MEGGIWLSAESLRYPLTYEYRYIYVFDQHGDNIE